MKFPNKLISKDAMTDKVASGIAKSILKFQSGFAKCMQSVTKNWKDKQQWVFLYLVSLCFGGLSIVTVINSFKTPNINSNIIPKAIAVPKNVHQKTNGFAITKNELRQVLEYKEKHPNLQQEQPGLFDSLNLIEEVYYSQKK